MPANWYNGNWGIEMLIIDLHELHTIHANAFNGSAFQNLAALELDVEYGGTWIRDGAFNGLEILRGYTIISETVHFSACLFDSASESMHELGFSNWPNNINLDEMFGNQVYRMLSQLTIDSVTLPQTKFNLLSASNFTAFRRLSFLHLRYCGIEVIDEYAFDVVGRTLLEIDLTYNRIKVVHIELFRVFLESNTYATLLLANNEACMKCTCKLIEFDAMHAAFRDGPGEVINCMLNDGFDPAACNVYRDVDPWKLCSDERNLETMRIVSIRMAHRADSNEILVQTNLVSKNRILVVNMNAMKTDRCFERAYTPMSICLIINKTVDRINLNDIEVDQRDSEFIAITVIPILHNFGAKPMHLMTVRRPVVHDERYFVALIGGGAAVAGAIAGLIAVLCRHFIRQQQSEAATTTDDPQSYEYVYVSSTAMIDNNQPYYYEYRAENHIDHYDANYTAVY